MWGWVTYIVLLCSFIFILLFGQSNIFKQTFIAKIHRFITETIPNLIYYAFRCCLGRKTVDICYSYLMETNHPLLQIFYLTLVTSCVAVFLFCAWHRIPNSRLSEIHLIIVPTAIITVYGCFFKACWSDPGTITSKNVEKACQVWEYDYILFNPKICSTCLIDKPARSKHCSICKKCVAKADHHCAWINNCVGHYNYRYFIMFLGSTAAIAMYGTYLVFRILQHEMETRQVWNFVVYDRKLQQRTPITFWQAIMYVGQIEPLLSALALFAGIAGVVVLVFMLYQLSMVLRGKTSTI
ncbi:DHHC palmitoyltransferase-domain-containing protein [Chytridium lagenaria]|nr:DHHC palmitoyltransferase-domain-containing protein [Chytridium lagenaria]